MKDFRQVVLSNGEAFDNITGQGNCLVGVVNMLGSATKRIMAEMNTVLEVLEQQRTIIDNLTMVS